MHDALGDVMQEKKYEIFANEGLSNIFDGAAIPAAKANENQITPYKVVGYRLENNLRANVTIGARTIEDCNGVYKGVLNFQGIRRKSRNKNAFFFPASWTRENVVEAIFEAYQPENFVEIDKGLHIGKTATEMKIAFWLDEDGKILDAMPLGENLPHRKKVKIKKLRLCNQCGRIKQTICVNHHKLPNPKISELIYKKIRRYSRKLYFNFARQLGFIE
jgi:hypothetical protein